MARGQPFALSDELRPRSGVDAADPPSDIKDRQGSAYTWAILMDDRIREHDW